MATYYRRDDWVNNGFGQPVPNVSVAYYTQPALTLASVYSDSIGTPAANPQTTDGSGHAIAYLAAGFYTVSYSGAQIAMLTLPDQEVSALISFYMTVPVTPTGTPNGILRTFGLPSSPTNPTASQLFVIGGGGGGGTFIPYGSGYTISGSTITWVAATPPQTGDTIEIFYS